MVYRGGLSRTGFVAAAPAPPYSVAWQNTGAALKGNQSTPVAADGIVFFGTAGTVYAVNAADGSTKWTYPSPDVLTNPDVAHPGLFDSQATVADGKVFIGNDDGKLYVLDEATGALDWQVATAGVVRSAPIVSNGVVYFGSGDTKLYAIREDTQKPVWGGEFRTAGQILTGAAISPGNIYFVDGNNTLYSAALASGRLSWSIKFQGSVADSPPILADGVIIVGSGRDLYGISPSVGAIRWHITLPATLTAQVTLSGDGSTIYAATSDDDVVALDTRGAVQWTAPLGSPISISPVATDNFVIAITHTGIVRVLSASTGHMLWEYPLSSVAGPRLAGSTIAAAPLVTPTAIYTLAEDGTLTAFRRDASDDLPPTAYLEYPYQNTAVPGAQIPYTIFVNDYGSGVNPASLALKVDGASVPVAYDVNGSGSTGNITVQTTRLELGKPIPVALPTLTSGTHALTLTISDWRGNQLSQTWNFTVNDALNPAGSALPPSANPAASATSATPSPNNSGQSSSGATATSGTGSGDGSGGAANTGGTGGPGGAGSSGSGGSGAQPTSGSGGAGPVPTAPTGSGPVPTAPTGGGAVPVSPVGSGSSFPPAPPI